MHLLRLCGSLLLLAFLEAACALPSGTSHAPEKLPPLPTGVQLQDALDRAILAAQGDPHLGVAAAVLDPGYAVWTGASGNSTPETPMSPGMVFDVGSVAKNFEAALVLQLAEEGKLCLDDSLSQWLPPLTNVSGDITIRQLLSHTSGVFNVFEHPDFPWLGPDTDYAREWQFEEVFDAFVSQPYFAPGEGQYYSSTNYLLLTRVVEVAGNAPVETLLRSRLIVPNGLQNTYVTVSAPPPAEYNVAHPWADIGGDGDYEDLLGIPLTWKASLTHPVIYSTPGDIIIWLHSLYNEQSVLSPASMDEMLSFPRIPIVDSGGLRFGLGVADFSQVLGVPVIGHAGSSLGYSAAALYFPETGTSVAWMLNIGEGPASLAGAVMMSVWEELSGVLEKGALEAEP